MADQPAVLALGAWLKNTACLLDAQGPHWSAQHGDLQDPNACTALEASARALAGMRVGDAARPLAAIAHDLHPDFFSTRLARRLAAEWGLPVHGVQHHHAHIAAVMAEHGLSEPVVGLALDGVGLGTDGLPWGGELLWVAPSGWQRLGHLWPLAMPGGDKAAREPWRMLAAALHAMGRADEIEARLSPAVDLSSARLVRKMLDTGLHCPQTTSAGRWFDAAAAALGLHEGPQREAEAAIALERHAQSVPTQQPLPPLLDAATLISKQAAHNSVLDLRPLMTALLDTPATSEARAIAAAWFHQSLAEALAHWAHEASLHTGARTVCLGGGCFLNQVLKQTLTRRLQALGLRVCQAERLPCGDAGLALGQAWVVAQQLHAPAIPHLDHSPLTESCA